MPTQLLAAAGAVAMALLPDRSEAKADAPLGSWSDSAALVVDRLRMHQRVAILATGLTALGALTPPATRVRHMMPLERDAK